MRTAANNNLSNGTSLGLNSFTAPSFFYINPDPVIGITTDNPVQLAPAAQVGTSRNNTPADPVNLTNAGIGALTNAILTNQDAWSLADGTGGNPATQATDNAPTQYSNAYLTSTDASSGGNALTLNGTEGTNYSPPPSEPTRTPPSSASTAPPDTAARTTP